MKFRRIKYLEWIKNNIADVEYDLATPSFPPCTLEDLSIHPEQIQLNGSKSNEYEALQEQIETTYNVPRERTVVTHGVSMGIFLTLNALLEDGSEALLEVPNYEPFYRIAKAIGARVRILERSFEDHFQLNLEQLERKISKRTDVVVITNLHNPSGVATNPEKLRTIGQIARENQARLICGEAYLETALDHSPPPVHKNTETGVSIGGLSKAFGLDGLRIGWIFCDEPLKREIHSIKNYMTPRTAVPSQQFAAAALNERETILNRSRKLVRQNIDLLENWVENRDEVTWVPPDGGPICVLKIINNIDTWDLITKLKDEYGTLLVPGEFFWAKGFVRIGFGRKSEILQTGLNHVGTALDELTSRPSIY